MMFTNIYNDVETDYCSVDLITYKAIDLSILTQVKRTITIVMNSLCPSNSLTGHHSEYESPAIVDKDM